MRLSTKIALCALVSIGNACKTDAEQGIAGTYATVVTLGQNTCGSVTVQDMPTVVTHTPGATTFSMTHGSQTYSGTLAADSTFTTSPLNLTLNGNQYTITMTGRFTGSGLAADVRLDVIPPGGGTCFYLVHWSGTRR